MKQMTRTFAFTAIIAFLMIASIIVPAIASADPGDEDGYGCWGDDGWNGGSWWFVAVMMVILGIGALFLFVFLLEYRDHSASPPPISPVIHSPPPRNDNPFQIVDQRYSRGEITREEYLQMKNDLNR